ncbi:MAG: efflux RND transporter periplasmic adaptor subunit [Rhodocyclaceae bacterium]|jgi:cobalt-zinc-cadmium efflux system membrane fusion protein|nr:efflux RND transporter periplasmic adaptor subunit [Rhodocyclaceae bacterium]
MRLWLMGVALGLSWFAQAAEEALVRMTEEQAARMGVVLQTVGATTMEGRLRLPAQVMVPPAQIEVVTAPLPALVTKVLVAYGETVRKGQPLARLQGAAFLEAQRAYQEARAQAALAAENRQRDEALFADGIISQARLSASRANEREAAARLAEKRQALRLAGLAESDEPGAIHDAMLLRAPFDGVVLEAMVQPGQRVDAQTSLVKLGRLAPLWLEMQASAEQAAHLSLGDAVSLPGCAQPARVTLVASQVQMASQSVLIRAEMDKPGGCVKPFQFVQAEVAKRHLAGGTMVPTAALVRHQGKSWIFLAVEGGFRPLPVEVEDESPGSVRIKAELPANARIAVKGVAAIKAAWLGLGASGE